MTRVLMLVTGAARRCGASGAAAPAGFWASEVLDSYQKLRARDVKVTVATADGAAAEADPVSLEPRFHYGAADIAFTRAMARASMRAAEDVRIDLASMTERQAIVARRIGRFLLAASLAPPKVQSLLEGAMAQVLRRQARLVDALLEQQEVRDAADRTALERIVQDHAVESRTRAAAAHAALKDVGPLSSPTHFADLLGDGHDAIVVCGGAGASPASAAAERITAALESAYRKGKPVALLSHGTAALLPGGRGHDGRWVFDGFVMTAPVDEERKQLNAAFGLDCEQLESRLKNRGAVFNAAEAWAPHVSVDRNLITAQNYLSAASAMDALLEKLP